MDAATVRTRIEALARSELSWEGPLPEGDLAEHLDSVQRLTLVVAIEDTFEICFEPEDDESATTLDDVIGVVVRRLAEAPEGDGG